MANYFDFENDLKNAIHPILKDIGIRLPIREKLDEMLLDYLTIMKKMVALRPRQVIFSPVLTSRLSTNAKRYEIELLAKFLQDGKNVNCFQSKKLFQTRFHDHLLYEWNIFHFHLSTQRKKNEYFVKQTNQLLFVYIDDFKAIFLDIETHKEGIFADTKWLEILHDYYPQTIEQYLDNDIIDVYPNVNSVERQTLWDSGLTLGLTKVRDKIYWSPGIGRATSGHSILVTMNVDNILRWVYNVKSQFQFHKIEICNYFNLPSDTCQFKLIFGYQTFEIIERNSKLSLLKYPQDLRTKWDKL